MTISFTPERELLNAKIAQQLDYEFHRINREPGRIKGYNEQGQLLHLHLLIAGDYPELSGVEYAIEPFENHELDMPLRLYFYFQQAPTGLYVRVMGVGDDGKTLPLK